MSTEISDRFKFDPSDIRQTFSDISIRLHCCRYWMLSEWDCLNMASPFWRLYFNSYGNALVEYNGISTKLTSDKILLIPPNTSFSSILKNSSKEQKNIVGKKIEGKNEIEEIAQTGNADHLFIHFNLGTTYDYVRQGIYCLDSAGKIDLLEEIKDYCILGDNSFNFKKCATVNSLIFMLLKDIPVGDFALLKLDKRVTDAMYYIDKHVGETISNKMLSDRANMVENSFARLFKENTGSSIQQYIKRKRIDKALIELHHSNADITEIASVCGFSDRFHFSKVFKELMGISPVSYKKNTIF